MERQIKFRAWDMVAELMIYSDQQYGLYFFEFYDGELGCFYINEKSYSNSIDEPPEPHCDKLNNLMQFTGLHDKDGREIYEGDICENCDWESGTNAYNYIIEVVKYDEDTASFYGWNYNRGGMSCKVIGNIFEHPELKEG